MNDVVRMIEGPVRTRFAPSPTGRLHLGNVRIAVFNWLFTRHYGGSFVVRIEDTDLERNLEGSEAGILEDLAWLGLECDEAPGVEGPFAPYRQSERGTSYAEALERLRASGCAYPCFCEEQSSEDRRYPGTCRSIAPDAAETRIASGEAHVFRFRCPDGEAPIAISDVIRGRIEFPAADIDDFVLQRRDGRPTYNFAVVIDDITMQITDVIRGAGHVPNTPKQVLLYEALGVEAPRFAHLPTVLSPEGGKLSKRSGAAAVAELRDRGVPPEAVVNYLSLLGWSHPDEKEVLTPGELVASLDMARVGVSDTRYDGEKFAWVAQQHIARMSEEEFLETAREAADRDRFPLPDGAFDIAALAFRSRMSEFGQVNTFLSWVLPDEGEEWEALRREVSADEGARTVLASAARLLQEVDVWEPGAVKAAIMAAGKEVGVKGKALFMPVRKVVTAAEHGPDIAALLTAVGREEVLRRIETTLAPKGV